MRRVLTAIGLCAASLTMASPVFADDGDVDTTWGGTGIVLVGISDYDRVVAAHSYGSTGIQIAGTVNSAGQGGWFQASLLMRFRSDGTLDTSCNSSGYTMWTTQDPVNASDMAVLDDGSTIIVGTIASTQTQGVVLKYTPSCQLDNTFGIGGVATYTDRAGVSFSSVDIAVDDSIMVGGHTNYAQPDGGGTRFTVVKLTDDGTIDQSFGPSNNGVFVSDGLHQGRVADLFVDSSGRAVFAGTSTQNVDDDAVVGRLTPAGVLDHTYAVSGWFTRSGANEQGFSSLAQRPNGGLVAVGIDQSLTNYHGSLICLAETGTIETSCGASGVSQLSLPSGAVDYRYWSVVVDDMGRFVVSGIYDDPTVQGGSPTPIVVRILSSGTPDTTFGATGVIPVPFQPGQAITIARDRQGRILVGGYHFTNSGEEDGPIVRLSASTTTSTTTTAPSPTVGAPASTEPVAASGPTTAATTHIATSTVSPTVLPATGGRAQPGVPFALLIVGLGFVFHARRRSNMAYLKEG